MLKSAPARLLILTLVHFWVDFCGGLNVPLPEPTLTNHLGVDLPRVALLLGGFGILVNLIQPVSGWLLPKRGMPMLLVLSPLAAACAACIGLTTSYWGVAMLLVVTGLGIGMVHPEGALAAHSVSGDRRGIGMSTFMAGGYLGYATGSLVSGLWVERHDQSLANFWLLALPALVVVPLVLASGLHRLEGHVQKEETSDGGAALPFGWVLVLAICVAGNMGVFTRLLPILLVRTFPGQNAQGWAGAAVFATGITGAVGAFLWGHLSDKHGRGKLIALLQVACIPFLYLSLHTRTPAMVPVWAAGVGLTMGGVFPLVVVLARQSRGVHQRLRMGLAIGGAWGVGELVFIGATRYIGRFPPADPAPVSASFSICWLCVAAAAVLGGVVAAREKHRALSAA